MNPITRPLFGDEEKQALHELLNSSMHTQGSHVEAFEQAFVNAIEKSKPTPIGGKERLVGCSLPYCYFNPVWITR